MPLFGGSDDRGRRTATEREEARRERERRRAQRGGGSDATAGLDAPLGLDSAAGIDAPSEPDAATIDAAAALHDALTGSDVAAKVDEAAEVGASAAADEATDADERPQTADLRRGQSAGRNEAADARHAQGAGARHAQAGGTRRLEGAGLRKARAAAFRRAQRERRGGEPAARLLRSPRTLPGRIGAGVSLLIVAVLVWLIVSIFQPFQGSGEGRVVVVIPKGAGASEIGGILAKDGVVASGFFFDVRTFFDGKRGDFHAGRFALKHDMSYASAIAALTGKVPHAAVVRVVIPEGETRQQIAAIARRDGLKGDYLAQTKRNGGFEPSHYGAPTSTPSLEGFLFPATYEIDVHGNVSALVTEQLEAFHERFDSQFVQRAQRLKITPYQLLIVASMIEREAKLPKDRPLVAAVIYNRLRLGMPLGIDATIRYAVHNFSKPLTEAQLHVSSPYNTRLHTGLPPTPISNPGVEAIEAAASPAKVGYLYYVNGTDGCGDLVFSSSVSQFERDSAAYEAAVNANGGNEPTCKKG